MDSPRQYLYFETGQFWVHLHVRETQIREKTEAIGRLLDGETGKGPGPELGWGKRLVRP